MKLLLLACSAVSLVQPPPLPPSEYTKSGHTKDSLDVVRERVESKTAILLDVREKAEWDAGHLKHARLLPLTVFRSGKLTSQQQKYLSRDKPIYLHCKSGGRVLTVRKLLEQKGYDVRPLQAGYSTLLKKGFKKAIMPKKP